LDSYWYLRDTLRGEEIDKQTWQAPSRLQGAGLKTGQLRISKVYSEPSHFLRLQGEAFSTTQLDLLWINNSSLETGYQVERSLDGTNWTVLATLDPNEGHYYDSGLTEETTYHYRVTALGSAVNSLPVQTTASTEMESSFDLQAEVDGDEISLEWTNNSAGGSTTYLIRRRIWGGSWIDLDTTGIGITSYTDETIEEGAFYQYRVDAIEDSERVHGQKRGHSSYSILSVVVVMRKYQFLYRSSKR
jgi:hypothetical protein